MENDKLLSSFSRQVGGNHYADYAIQPLEFCVKNNIPFLEGNVIKYICRWRNKNGIQDLEKAKHYIEMLIELEKAKHYIEMLIELEKANDDSIKWTDKSVQDLRNYNRTGYVGLERMETARRTGLGPETGSVQFLDPDY